MKMYKHFRWIGSLGGIFVAVAASAATFTVATTNDSGPGSLRQALLNVNASPGPHRVQFNLPGNGVQTLAPLTPLPEITNSVTIDGYSQPGSRPNSLAWDNDALLLVRLDGVKLTNGLPAALTLRANACTVRGLILVRFAYGIQIHSGSGNGVAGNWIGLDWDGIARGMTFDGIEVTCPVFGSAMNNTIGGQGYGDRNVISGNGTGVSFFPTTAANNAVIGNFIGTDASGKLPRGNVFEAVNIQSATNIQVIGNVLSASTGAGGAGVHILGGSGDVIQGNWIGHGVAGQDLGNASDGIFAQGVTGLRIGGDLGENRIGFNRGHGIELLGCTGAIIQNNNIGTGSVGAEPYGNLESGIYLSGSSSNSIGGPGGSGHNTIVYNGGAGIAIASGTGNRISANDIYDNGGPGIDLGNDGPTPNDPGDTDTGANQLQNTPVLTSAAVVAGCVLAQGSLNSQPATAYRLEFFASWPWDALWMPEGQVYLGTTNVTTGPNGTVAFAFSAEAASWLGDSDFVLTATATDPAGNTSEFSGAMPLRIQSWTASLATTPGANGQAISWPSAAGTVGFQLETADALTSPVWRLVTTGIADDGTTKRYQVTNNLAVPQQFFRLRR